MRNGERIHELECGHLRTERAGDKDMAQCVRGCGMQHIKLTHNGYSWKCVDCKSGRKFGMAKLLCFQKRDAHCNRYPTHTAVVALGPRIIDRRIPRNSQLDMFDMPPF